jgi:hypothetical protein
MSSFASFDQVLQSQALTPMPPREIAPSPADFKPLFAAAALTSGQATRPKGEACAPQIELVEGNGRVQQIIVTCGCGERTVLDCAY